MKYNTIAGKYKVSCVGIGGHYSKMEEGLFEERYANVDAQEVKKEAGLLKRQCQMASITLIQHGVMRLKCFPAQLIVRE